MSGAAPRRHLGAGAAMSVVAQAAPLAVGALLSIALARTVGPAGNGGYSLVASMLGIVSLIFSLGLTSGLTYEVSTGRLAPARAMWLSSRVALGLGALGIAAGAAFYVATRHTVMDEIEPVWAAIALASVPAFIIYQFASAISLGGDHYEAYTGLEVTHALVILVGAGLAIAFGLEGAIVALSASGFVTAVLGLWLVRRQKARVLRASQDGGHELHNAFRFGLKSWVGNLLQQINYRFDLLILGAFAATTDVGHYSVAITLTGIAWVLPQALQTVLFPRAANLASASEGGELTKEESDAQVARATRHSTLLLVPTAMIVAFLLLVAVPLLYGPRFHTTIGLGFVLLPGVLVIGVAKVLSAVVAGRGKPEYTLYIALASAIITLALYLALIPPLGAWGAALGSTISYVFTTVITVAFFQRLTGIGLKRTLLPSRADLNDYRDAFNALRRRFPARRLGESA